jgi:hypothetical protein
MLSALDAVGAFIDAAAYANPGADRSAKRVA